MNRIKKLSILFLSLLLTGCLSYKIIDLDVLRPADIKIPVEITSVVVVDNAYPFYREDSAIHKLKTPMQEFTVDSVWVRDFGKRTVEAFGESLKQRRFFDSVHVVKQSFNTSEDGKPMQPLSNFVLDTLARHFNAQAVISLNHYEYGTTINVTEAADNYYATLDARSNTYWKFHNQLTGELLDLHLQKDTIFWESAGVSIGRSTGDLPGIKEALIASAEHAGERYAEYVAPTWSNEKRIVYKQGDPLFIRAAELINSDDWEEANRIWYHVYQEGRDKPRARAAYNLALGKEVLGEFSEAVAWAYRSLEIYNNLGAFAFSEIEKAEAQQYYMTLSKRLLEKKKLDEQYGVEEN